MNWLAPPMAMVSLAFSGGPTCPPAAAEALPAGLAEADAAAAPDAAGLALAEVAADGLAAALAGAGAALLGAGLAAPPHAASSRPLPAKNDRNRIERIEETLLTARSCQTSASTQAAGSPPP